MKKFVWLFLLISSGFLASGQKVSGTVYSEHEAIQKTKAAWNALFKGDKVEFLNFYADTVDVYVNGAISRPLRKDLASRIDYWAQFENLSVRDDKPGWPDALEYKDGSLFVQDWLRITGTHKATGINLDLPIHCLYAFNKDGKIKGVAQYFNDADFREIGLSPQTIENGKVYINHPLIITVRKLVNAYCAGDLEKLLTFYSPKAYFFSSTDKFNDFKNLTTKTVEFKETFLNYSDIKLVQFGYPDCIYYDKGNTYVVYSWWKLSCTDKNGIKRSDIPVIMSHTFDKDGKVDNEMVYLSSNHFQ